jgi:polysaccharide pyruvyl transferase WcaK-like protein
MSDKLFIYGWYYHGNSGDELFKSAFSLLFPNYKLIFSDSFDNIQDASAIIIGGGSFVYSDPKISNLDLIKSKPIFYLGIGVEKQIHPVHQELMKIAKLIAVRSSYSLEQVKQLNPNVIVIPDLVYSLSKPTNIRKLQSSILILPNHTLVPQWNDPYWKHQSWSHFKLEFAQFLDDLSKDHEIHFYPMCENLDSNDAWAAIEIINKMQHKNLTHILSPRIDNILETFSTYQHIITQRYHGIVLAELLDIPYINIHHHDKLKYAEPCNGNKISYYNLSKDVLHQSFNLIKPSLSIDKNIFTQLQHVVGKYVEIYRNT